MAPIPFEGQIAVVTGSGRGLGRAYALELARRGAAVVVNDFGEDETGRHRADDVVDEILAAGGRAAACYASVTTPEGGRAVVGTALDRFGTVDIVINNAGIRRHGLFEHLTADDIDAVIDSHLKAAFFVTQPAWCVMKEKQYGRVVLTSSASGAFGREGHSNYAAAKAGLIGLGRVLALEGKHDGILVNTVMPMASTPGGVVSNNATMHVADSQAAARRPPPDSGFSRLVDRSEPERVAALVVYLASERCSISGESFSAVSGRYSSVFTGVTNGWAASDEDKTTAEDVARHLDEVRDRTDYAIPASLVDEVQLVLSRLGR